MKKIYFLLIVLMGAICFHSCEKQEPVSPGEKQIQQEEELIDGMLKGAMSPEFIREDATPFPYFARMGAGAPKGIPITNDGKYGMVFFYVNDPVKEIPPDFDLMNFFVFGIENWFMADYSTEGYSWFLPEYEVPYMSLLWGTGAVPFWFITAEQVDQVYADEVITISELQNLNPAPMIGYASRFTEFLRPVGGGAPVFGIYCGAFGKMEDGRNFFVKYRTRLEADSSGPMEFDLDIYFYKSWW